MAEPLDYSNEGDSGPSQNTYIMDPEGYGPGAKFERYKVRRILPGLVMIGTERLHLFTCLCVRNHWGPYLLYASIPVHPSLRVGPHACSPLSRPLRYLSPLLSTLSLNFIVLNTLSYIMLFYDVNLMHRGALALLPFPLFPPPPHPSHPLSQVMSIMKQVVDDFIKEKGSEYDARKGPSAR